MKIGNMAKAVIVTGQAHQDPRDALNEFAPNAAGEYAEVEPRRNGSHSMRMLVRGRRHLRRR